jgi:hypothetical protein
MTCRRCGGPITDAYCDDCGLLALHPPVLVRTTAPADPPAARRRAPVRPARTTSARPVEASIARHGWAPRAAAVRAPKILKRPLPRLTLVGIVIVLAGLGWFAIRSPNAPAESDLTTWKVGACVRIAPDGRTWPVHCETANDGMVVRQVAVSAECPANAQWWVARESDGFCVRRNAAPSATVAASD